MPVARHTHSRFDFKALLEWCLGNDKDFDALMVHITAAICSVEHVKKAVQGQSARTKRYVGVYWDYPIPTPHLSRRELAVEEAAHAAVQEWRMLH